MTIIHLNSKKVNIMLNKRNHSNKIVNGNYRKIWYNNICTKSQATKNEGCDNLKHYSITVTELYDDKLKQLAIYGIEYSNGERTLVIEDITTDYERLKRLINLCNELELEVSQLNDVVEDFLSE